MGTGGRRAQRGGGGAGRDPGGAAAGRGWGAEEGVGEPEPEAEVFGARGLPIAAGGQEPEGAWGRGTLT